MKGIESVKRAYKVKISEIADVKTARAILNILDTGGQYADMLTPIDTGNLLRSRYLSEVSQNGTTMTGRFGYTAAYAGAVHNAPGKLKGQPRGNFGVTRAGVAFGGGTGAGEYWDPDAEPKFLEKGFEQLKPDIPAILKDAYK